MSARTTCAMALLIVSQGLSATLIQPDTALSFTEFSGFYAAVYTINGSGLPANFIPADAHDDYSINNHWITSGGDPSNESIVWGFSSPQTLGAIYLWNHRSNIISANAGYAPTLFDLTLMDAGMAPLLVLDDVPLASDTATGQTIGLGGLVASVSFVRFDVEAVQSSPNYTGLAEVAFDTSAIPAPPAVALMITDVRSLLSIARRKG